MEQFCNWFLFTFVNVSEDMIRWFDPLHHRFSKHLASTVVSICHDILNILFLTNAYMNAGGIISKLLNLTLI